MHLLVIFLSGDYCIYTYVIDQKWYIHFRYSCVIVAIGNTCSFSFEFNSFQLRLVDEHELCVYYGSKSLSACVLNFALMYIF